MTNFNIKICIFAFSFFLCTGCFYNTIPSPKLIINFEGAINGYETKNVGFLVDDNGGNYGDFSKNHDYLIINEDLDLPEKTISFDFKLIPREVKVESIASLDHSTLKYGSINISTKVQGKSALLYIKLSNFESNILVKTEKWYSLAITQKGMNYKIFLNGNEVEKGKTSKFITSKVGLDKMVVGCSRRYEYCFEGYLDNFYFFNTELTNYDISKLSKAHLLNSQF